MRLILASSNPHKVGELSALFPGYEILLPKDLGKDFSCVEDGSTYAANSLIKALAVQSLFPGEFVIADDSGLDVFALPGELGVHSARFGMKEDGIILSAKEKNDLLLKRLEGVSDRRARFNCCLTLLCPDGRMFVCQEVANGHIIDRETGTNGFGYDPVFFYDAMGCTMASLSAELKNKVSHRAKAASAMLAILKNMNKQNQGEING